MALETRVHASVTEIPEADWDALDGIRAAPFLTHAWLHALEATGCVGADVGWQPHHLSFWEAGRLVGAAPAYLKDNSEGEFVFDHAWAAAAERVGFAYYPKLIVAVPFTPATSTRLLVARPAERPLLLAVLADALRRLVHSERLSGAHVLFPPEVEAAALSTAGLGHRLGLQFHWQNEGYGSFDDFLGRFSSKRRSQIRRERREMQNAGITITTDRGPFRAEVIDAMFSFYTATIAKFPWGRRYLNRAFFEEICSKLPGKVEFVLAREGSRLLAGALNLCGETTLFGRYWGAAEERPFLHFNVCFYHAIEDCIVRKLARFEPGAGGEHKLVRGFAPAITHSAHHLAHSGLDRAVRAFVTRERLHVEECARKEDLAFR